MNPSAFAGYQNHKKRGMGSSFRNTDSIFSCALFRNTVAKVTATAIFIAFVSCEASEQQLSARDFFLSENRHADTLILDFQQTFDDFQNALVHQYSVNLCDTALSFVGRLPIKTNDTLDVNLEVRDICTPYIPLPTAIEMYVASDTSVRIGMTYIHPDSVYQYLMSELKTKFDALNLATSLTYHLEWHAAAKPATTKNAVFDALHALQDFISEEAIQAYGSSITELNEAERRVLMYSFQFTLLIAPVRPDLPIKRATFHGKLTKFQTS